MARIIVDGGGSWTSPSGKLLRAGVHETNDPILIEEALNEPLEWIEVVDDEADAAAAAVRETRKRAILAGLEPETPEKPAVTRQLVDTSSQSNDPSLNTSGPLTSADLHKANWDCNLCEFTSKTQAGLQSHRRNKHPEVDPSTGAPKEDVAPIVEQSVENRDTSPVAPGPVQGT